MGRTFEEVMASLPEEDRKRVEARAAELQEEYETLTELRKLIDRSQAEIAEEMGIKQPSVSKIEHQADMYISTLRQYVEALGGAMDIVVRLPGHRPVKLSKLGDAHS